MTAEATPPCQRVAFGQLRDTLARLFERHGTSGEVAAILADNCASAERDGAHSHGVFRIPGYLSSLASGWVDGRAVPEVQDSAPGFIAVDARNGFAQPAYAAARDLLVAKARANGIALLAIRNSHHFAALWPDVEPLAEQGLVGLALVNSMACVVPHGGTRPLFGTNPIAFAAPRDGHPPLVFDLATSAMAHGDVQIAAREGRLLPPAHGVDAAGQPTCDPRAVLDGGALLPFGGHKGSALSMMVELLAAALTGGHFSFDFDWSGHPGAQTPRTGELIIAIDPAKSAGRSFAQRCNDLVAAMADAGQQRQPGRQRQRQRAQSLREGVALPVATWAELQRLAAA
ncbi:Ldh family oxidoreductase [Pulveribacter suum]|uniref:Delta(1)-pyrroline-2-carboxylate/Delta(1)-piperideine-2-carboxylate reductase n=1 Tax=Pulveribacter suum TaxID=2116657 RepID=A0A2P1NMM7_9BURK|nr:Ldh family oxidoreductase [Pulveribacter suum]AVP58309.1 lactate dehydrogenase [Pulveribacter suum]